jgi:hypothetical protein
MCRHWNLKKPLATNYPVASDLTGPTRSPPTHAFQLTASDDHLAGGRSGATVLG